MLLFEHACIVLATNRHWASEKASHQKVSPVLCQFTLVSEHSMHAQLALISADYQQQAGTCFGKWL